MEYHLVTVVETRSFRRKAQKLLSETQLLELIVYLSTNPESGVRIKGTGGIRNKANLTGAEKNALRGLVNELVSSGYTENE
jgi:hypothetical protein